jgi:SRSO17 transposase
LQRYVRGVLSDSPRKSMEAMWARLSDPGSYQALQYFISEATWSADAVWRQLRSAIPAREGIVILDGTGFPKQGPASVGVQRQYSETLGKVGNCQVAVTAALWTGTHAWLLGALLYLPTTWLTAAQRALGRIPPAVRFQEKWRQALTLLRQIRAAGITVTAVAADAEFGDCATFRRTLHRWHLPYALGISSTVTLFRGAPRLETPTPNEGRGRPRSRSVLASGVKARAARAIAAQAPARAWRVITWRHGTNRPWRARFWACRVTPATDWRDRRVAPEVWLLCQRDLGETPETKYSLVNLPITASLKALVRLTHQRWAIEQQYQELKTELGLDHFEGRSYHGWHRHVVLTAIAYAFLQQERLRRRRSDLTFPQARAVITDILTAHYLITHPRYLDLMLKLKEIELRIWWSRPQPAVHGARASSPSSNRTCGFPASGFPRRSPRKP